MVSIKQYDTDIIKKSFPDPSQDKALIYIGISKPKLFDPKPK